VRAVVPRGYFMVIVSYMTKGVRQMPSRHPYATVKIHRTPKPCNWGRIPSLGFI
jgi:hypothetical protein